MGKMSAIIFICRNLFLPIAGKIANIAKIRTRISFVPHSKSVHQSTTSQLISHTAYSQSAILSVSEPVSQQVSLSVCQSIIPEVISQLVSNWSISHKRTT